MATCGHVVGIPSSNADCAQPPGATGYGVRLPVEYLRAAAGR
jgi:hypothetical protein